MTKQIKIDLSIGKCEEVLKDFEDNSIDSCICDPPYGLGQEPDPVDLLRAWIHEEEVKAGSGGFMGRCYHPDTEVRTKVGWKPISLIRKGDPILSRPPTAGDGVEWVPATKTFVYDYEGPMVHISGEEVEQVVTPNHNVWCPDTGKLVRADSLGTLVVQAGQYVKSTCAVTTTPYQGKVYCCELERNHVLLTRINGKTAWSGNSWDSTVPSPSQFREILRVVKPGKRSSFFFGTRTLHLGMASLRLAGFSIEDVWAWCYGCFDEETEVFVDGRWTTYETLREGQTIRAFTTDGRLVNTPIQGIIRIPDYDDIAYRIEGEHVDQLVSHNHRVVVWDGERGYERKVVDALFGGDRITIPTITSSGVHHEKVHVTYVELHQNPMWCVRVPTGMVVIRRNGKISVSGNSGFPKSHNVFKALKKKVKARYGDSRCQCVGEDYRYEEDAIFAPEGVLDLEKEAERVLILDDYGDHDLVTRVCSWCGQPDQGFIDSTQGLGTALKPSFEPVVLVSKPREQNPVDYRSILRSYGFDDDEIELIMTPPEDSGDGKDV